MTDKEKLIDLLKSFGINEEAPVDNPYDQNSNVFVIIESLLMPNIRTHVQLQNGIGYYGFYVNFTFDSDGKFIIYGVWE